MLVFVVLAAVAGGTSARASVVGHQARQRPPASKVVLGSSFQAMSGVTGVAASGDYLLLSTTMNTGFVNTGWTVINQRTGATRALDPACHIDALGPPWALMGCPMTSDPSGPYDAVLYSLVDGIRQTVTPSPGVPQCQWPPNEYAEISCAAGPDGVGTYWIRWDASCYNCAITSYFQNIQTGELRGDPTNATTFADLNSPTLAQETCPGVRLMPAYPGPWGSLTYDGQFALVTGGEVNVFLKRCGARMQRRLIDEGSASSGIAWNADAVVWQAETSQLNGLFLPSLQSFTIPLPSAIVKPPGAGEAVGVGSLELSSDALYLSGGWDGTIWRTASPTALPLNTSQPSLTWSGSTLTCKRGSWREADRFSYAWVVNGVARKGSRRTLAMARARKPRRVSCNVTASNADGTTTASSAQLRVR